MNPAPTVSSAAALAPGGRAGGDVEVVPDGVAAGAGDRGRVAVGVDGEPLRGAVEDDGGVVPVAVGEAAAGGGHLERADCGR